MKGNPFGRCFVGMVVLRKRHKRLANMMVKGHSAIDCIDCTRHRWLGGSRYKLFHDVQYEADLRRSQSSSLSDSLTTLHISAYPSIGKVILVRSEAFCDAVIVYLDISLRNSWRYGLIAWCFAGGGVNGGSYFTILFIDFAACRNPHPVFVERRGKA